MLLREEILWNDPYTDNMGNAVKIEGKFNMAIKGLEIKIYMYMYTHPQDNN